MPEKVAPGIFWQSRMGNNSDGIGGNCHRYDIVTAAKSAVVGGGFQRHRLAVDFGIKIHNDDPVYTCSFSDPNGLFRKTGASAGSDDCVDHLFLTHCHEDHIGGLRHALDMGHRLPPIYCTPFTAEMVGKSLRRAGFVDPSQWPQINRIETGDTVRLGESEISFIAVDHLPGAAALLLRSADATVFHSGDYKFDSSLPLGKRADPALLRAIGHSGVDMVVSDSTASADLAAKISEAEIERALTRVVADQRGRAVIAGLLGTQLDRLVSLGRAATANDRAVIVAGSSLCDTIKAAERAGLSLDRAIGAKLLMAPEGRDLTADRALIVTTGAFAQSQAGLTRAAEALPGALYVDGETTVIIPQRAIPPVAEAHRAMVTRLQGLGARLITAENATTLGYGALHQSGHAIAADTRLLYSLLRPRHVVAPMHGGPQQINANAKIAEDMGIQTLKLEQNGVRVRVSQRGVETEMRPAPKRIGAAETGLVKHLPRAKPGEGRNPPPPMIYRYDRLDKDGKATEQRAITPLAAPSRPRPGNGRTRW